MQKGLMKSSCLTTASLSRKWVLLSSSTFQMAKRERRVWRFAKILREYHALCHGQLSHYLKVDADRLTMIDAEAYLDYF